ncbi:hypothetical protein BDF22DRAFT_743794 [Syncephalis plumigaleata]|nr:hypothetical protein BDF22DRAFT_743794 [Syncephalis plumigaleata]
MLAQTVPDCEVYATRLADPNLDIKLKVTIATELRDKVEIFQSVEYKRFLALLLPVFTSILRDGQPAFSSNASEQRLRQTILEIIHRFPHNDDLAQYASDLMGLLLRLLRVENEENAVLCLKIIIDLHRTYKELLEEHVQPFLNIVMEMYRNMPKAVADTFDHPCTPAPTSGGTPGSMMMMSPRPSSPADFGDTPAKALARGMHSFKPHRRSVAANIQSFVPLIMEMLSLQAKPQTEAHAAAAACGEFYTEFIIAQVKTASFLAYILRGYAAQLRQYQAVIPEAIIRLLRDCPPEASSTRKELLVATRHILSTDFRNAFIDHMDILLNEKVLIGTGVTSHETLRPLAFSMLADLVHHVRTKLALPQLSRTVYMYSRNLHDSTLASSIQTMCAKLLLNLVECIMHLPDRTKGRQLLMRILDTFTNKFQTLNSQFPIVRQRCLRANQQGQKRDTDKTNKEDTSTRGQGKSDDVMDVDLSDILGEDESELDLQRYKSIAVPATSHETHLDTLKDMRFLFRNLVTGLKTIMFGLKSLNPSTISTGQNTTTGTSGASGATPSTSTTATTTATNITSNSNVAIGFSHEEMTVFSRLFREGIRCFDYYVLDATLLSIAEGNTSQATSSSGSATTTTTSNVLSTTSLSSTIDPTSTSSSSSSSSSSDMWTRPVSKEEKETLEQFANVFITVDPAIFQEVFTAQMPYLFERILGNSAILAVPRCFLANESVSHNFSGILINFLVERLDLLGGQDPTCAEAMLRLLKLTFMAVTWFPQQNEEVLQPHLGNIIMSSMKMSAKAKDPIKYFLLLRSLFRYIGGGRFELLYKEVLPLVHMLLESFNTLLSLAHKQEMRELFVELCLTVPVRLSVLLPYLTFLMKPLVIALQAGSELISQGLRTLELCIDNLTQDFLDPIMAPVIDDLMRALWSHLQSNTTNEQYSQSTMRILGKLGGRNRRLLLNPPVLEYRPDNRNELNVELQFPDDIRLTLSIDRYISVAETVLADQQASKHSLEQAYLFVRGCLSLLIDTSDAHMNSQRLMAALRAAVQNATSSATSTSAVNTPNASTSSGSMVLSLVNHSEQQRVKQTHEAELIRLLYLIFRCATIASLKERAQAMLNQIVQHFALLSVLELISISTTATTASSATADEDIDMTVGSDSNNNGNGNSVHKLAGQSSKIGGPFGPRSLPSHSDKRVFVETLICVITDEDVALRNLAESALQLFYQTCLYCVAASPAGPYTDSDRELAVRIPFFHQLAMKFCSAATRNNGSVNEDASPELSTSGVEEARQTLAHVLKVCNRSDEDESNVERKQKFTNLVGLLVTELSNSNAAVRDTIQSSFQLLADLTGCEVTELLDPVRERLLRPIFTKPLRALPFAMQIGNIDAVTYCLSLRPPFLQCNDELLRLLHEALALADADDQALVSRTSQYKNAASLVNLRVVCIRLLSAAMTCSDFFNNRQSTIRQRIISVFFKSLYNKSSEVVDAAKKGLQQVLTQQHRLPKDLLQTGLRPILRNLSDHKRLTVPDLEGLARLLELLISYFKVEIGNKLLEHMKSWADPQVMQESAGKSLTEVHHIQIIVAIMNVFHLLPALSNIFLNDLVTETIRMEQLLRRDMSSPFRVPLIKFLNRYAAESIDYFLNRLADPSMSRLFLGLLGMEQATAFRSQLLRSPDRLIARAFLQQPRMEVRFQFILIVHQLCTLHSDWLMEHREIVDCLLELWRAPARRTRIQQQEEHMSLNRLQETRLLAETLILYVRRMPEEVDLIFDLLDVFTMPSVVDFSFLKQFLAMKWRFTPNATETQEMRTQALRILVNPIEQVIDASILEEIQSRIWRPLADQPANADRSNFGDPLRIELLQLTAMLVQYVPQRILMRKDVIKFAYGNIRLDDVTSKQAAYVLIARFIAAFETPPKIINQIFVALLRAHQSEAKHLVKQALDVLTPALPTRLANAPGDHPRFPTWARYTLRHTDQFYTCREYFLPQMVNTLPKLGLVPSATAETRALTLDQVETMIGWEKKLLASLTLMNKDDSNSAVPVIPPNEYTPNATLKEMILNYLTQFTCATAEYNSTMGADTMSTKALKLLKEAMQLSTWQNVDVNIRYLEVVLITNMDEIKEDKVPAVSAALQVLDFILERKSPQWLIENISLLQRLLSRSLSSGRLDLCERIAPILTRLYAHLPSPDEAQIDVATFYAAIDTILQEGLGGATTAATTTTTTTGGGGSSNTTTTTGGNNANASMTGSGNVSGGSAIGLGGSMNNTTTSLRASLVLLQACCKAKPDAAAAAAAAASDTSSLMGLASPTGVTNNGNNVGTPLSVTTSGTSGANGGVNASMATTPEQQHLVPALIVLLRLLKSRVSYLGDQRRWLLVSLIQLIERSPDLQLLRAILTMVSEWIKDDQEAFPTTKEKANLMSMLMTLDQRQDRQLIKDFLGLVVDIYENPLFARTELTVRLEHAFLTGLCFNDSELRTQHWDAIAKHFWITQACDLLLAGILADAPLTSRTRILSLPSLSKSISKSTNDVADVDDQPLASVLEQQRQLMTELGQLTLADLIQPLQQLLHLDDRIAYDTWVELFQASWPLLSVKERTDLTKALIPLLANPYQSQQATIRPNVPQALLEAAALCQPAVRLPPQLRGHSMDTSGLDEVNRSEELIRESTLDALTELYGHLAEDDLMFGLWRRRCMFSETNNALSFEQCSVWPVAQQMYEQAQLKARSGHWIHTTEQLQQWDILHDLARHENNPSLQLEAAWRQMDTPQFDAETMVRCLRVLPEFPRRKGIEAFLLLQENSTNEPDRSSLFHQLCNDGMKLPCNNGEAGQMCTLLLDTNAGNFDARFQELKALLQSWRERLPNYWDDMNQWSDLVAWRQLMFGAVNRTFLPLGSVLPPTVTANSAANSGIAGNSLAYRGYHEMAWMINRFARIARKHGMLDVCMNQLARIYTLPNIEIHEAFIKLKEQARCNLKNVGELASGLEVINNTNLAYFGVRQKAEFFALKGDFLARLERNDEANVAYAAATNADLNLPKAWSSWGRFLDGLFQQHPDQIEYASRAMDCYLQACCLQRSPKSRRHIARILWLLSTDDAQGTVAKTFETFKGDVAICQLSSRTARHARLVLERIAKSFPQALHYQLRTMREEYEVLLRRNPSMLKTLRKKATESASNSVSASTSITGGVTGNNASPSLLSEDDLTDV